MSDHTVQDPYHLHPEAVENPPHTFGAVFRRIGPGLILASTIVGSGELIATTVLGAENGYTLLWLIPVSCAIKVVVQNEFGRYVIATGETTLEAFDRVPGPRWRVSWVVWLWFVMVMMSMFAVGGMMGAIAEVLNNMFPAISVNVWVWIVNLVTVILLVVGRYTTCWSGKTRLKSKRSGNNPTDSHVGTGVKAPPCQRWEELTLRSGTFAAKRPANLSISYSARGTMPFRPLCQWPFETPRFPFQDHLVLDKCFAALPQTRNLVSGRARM